MTSGTGRSGIPSWMLDYVDAWNSHDPAKVLACMTDDVVFDDKGLGERLQGTDAVRAMLVDLTETMSSDYRLDWGDLLVSTDDLWAGEWTMSGTNDRAGMTERTERAACPTPAARSGSRGCRSGDCGTDGSPRSTCTGTWPST